MSRVIIPTGADDMISLVNLIIAKETALGTNKVLTDDELAELTTHQNDAKDANDKQKQYYKDAEEQTRRRDNALGLSKGITTSQPGNAMYIVTSLRDVLMAKNKTNPNVLGEWGFVVDSSPKKKKVNP